MRSLTTFVVTAVVVMISGTASAEDMTSRLTADVFVVAEFPTEIIEAAHVADEIAEQTQKNRAKAQQDLELIEPVFDRAVFMSQIPLELFKELQGEYEATLQKLWFVDRELRQADAKVVYLYYSWALENSDTKAAQVFQEWQTAAQISYISVSAEEEEAYRLMIGIGRSRIITGYHERGSRRRPAPLTMWGVNNDE